MEYSAAYGKEVGGVTVVAPPPGKAPGRPVEDRDYTPLYREDKRALGEDGEYLTPLSPKGAGDPRDSGDPGYMAPKPPPRNTPQMPLYEEIKV